MSQVSLLSILGVAVQQSWASGAINTWLSCAGEFRTWTRDQISSELARQFNQNQVNGNRKNSASHTIDNKASSQSAGTWPSKRQARLEGARQLSSTTSGRKQRRKDHVTYSCHSTSSTARVRRIWSTQTLPESMEQYTGRHG
jgi:hypothetical protein